MNRIICLLLLVTAGLTIFTSCSDNLPETEIDNPIDYTFERNGQSTVDYGGQSIRIAMSEELISAMMDFSMTEEQLLEMFANQQSNGQEASPFNNPALNETTKSIKSKVAASKDFFSSNTVETAQIRADFEAWITAQVKDVFPYENQLASEGIAGQIVDGSATRYVNSKGLEFNQAVNKSLIGALMIDQMVNNYLSTSVLDEGHNISNNDNGILEEGQNYTTMEHKWDEAYGYLFGAASAGSNPVDAIGNSDSFLNKYLARVDNDSDFTGISQDVFEAFKLGRAAIVAGDYDTRDEQAEIIKEKIATVIGVRAVYYLQQGKRAFENGLTGTAFHDLSEGFGFIYSLRFCRKAYSNESYFSREEVDNFLNMLTEGNGFWDVEVETLNAISEAIANKFSFTIEQAAE